MPTTTTDYNLVYGWNVQNSEPSAGSANGPGTTPAGYAQPATVAPPATQPSGSSGTGQAGSGNTNSAIGPLGGPAGGAPILENEGYAGGNGTMLGQLAASAVAGSYAPLAPAVPLTTAAVQNPTGLAALVTITGGTVTAVSVAPLNTSVNPAVAGAYTVVSSGETASETTVTVPPAGFIKMTYSSAPTWTWVTTN